MGMDIASKLLQQRIVIISGPIYEELSTSVINQLLYLKNSSKDKVTIIIKSVGGSVYEGLGIYDVMQSLKKSGIIVQTIGCGMCMSMGSFLISGGSKGYRKVYPNCTTMIHQPSGGTDGQVTDMLILVNEANRLKTLLTELYIKNGAISNIAEYMERDLYLTPDKAIELGLVDEIYEQID